MRAAVLSVLVLAAGCNPIADSLLSEILDGIETFTPPPEVMAGSSRLAFVTSTDSSNVVCFVLDSGGTDLVAQFSSHPVGIATGTTGELFISTGDGVSHLSGDWISVGGIEADAGVEAFGPLAAGWGRLVVAGETSFGSLVAVYDPSNARLIGLSEPNPGTTIRSVAVAGTRAFVAESPGGAIAVYNITAPTPLREPFIDAVPGGVAGVVVGHNGNLFVAHAEEPIVEEFDLTTGESLGTLWQGDVTMAGGVGLAFDGDKDRYLFLGDDDTLREISRSGELLSSRFSTMARGVNGVAFVGP